MLFVASDEAPSRECHPVGATLGGYPPAVMREMFEEANDALLGMLDAGTFRVTATRVVELDEVPGALADLAARRTLGRAVVRIA